MSLAEIQQHIKSEILQLGEEGISLSTRLFPAPNHANVASQRHKRLVPARVWKKLNNKTKDHPYSHFAKTQVKYALELGACYSDEIILVSADAKAKVNTGGAAVSRYVKMKSYV